MNANKTELATALANSLYQRCKEGAKYNVQFHPPNWGYLVVVKYGPTFKTPIDVSVPKVARFIEDNMPKMGFPLYYFGVGISDKTGTVGFYLAEQFANKEQAVEYAKENEMLTIWDVENENIVIIIN